MNPLAWDTETSLIRPAMHAPPLACVTWQRPGLEPRIDGAATAELRVRTWLEDRETVLVGHFVAYDCAVICAAFPALTPLVFAAYRSNRVTCTKKRQQLLDIAGGVYRGRVGSKGQWVKHNYDLDALSRRLLGKPLQKDGWRLSYAEFIGVPIDKWVDRAREVQAKARIRRVELPNINAMPKKQRDKLDKSLVDEVRNLDAIIADVPEGCIRYPLDDASTTLGVYQAQEVHAEYLKDQYRQAYADFVLYLSSVWGMRTHAPGVAALKLETQAALDAVAEELEASGLVRADGSRDTKAAKRLMVVVCAAHGIPLRRTDGHAVENTEKCVDVHGQRLPAGHDDCVEHVSLDADACAVAAFTGDLETGEDGESEALGDGADVEGALLGKYAEFSTLKKVLSNDVEMLSAGITYPVHTRYDIAETGRTTSSKPNIQNLRRLPGIREAFIPRLGKVFVQADYPQLELYALAQCCFSWLGHSKLGEALNGGLDPHLAMAATILGITYEVAKANKKRDDVDAARQVAKVFNFGKPGGLGNKKLILFARKTYGVVFDPDPDRALRKAQEYTEQWHATWPEMRAYFARVNGNFGNGVQRASVTSLFTERIRGGATYCAACNNGFQGLGVDCAKRALTSIAEAQYCDTASPLFGSRTVAFVHDEVIAETDDTAASHDAAVELSRLMVQGAQLYLPDVPIRAESMEPTLMRVWSKKAVQVWDANQRLVPWSPEREAA